MGVYHLHLRNISRESGRSAVGAAAYRTGEKLTAVSAAAYRAGEDLEDMGAEIIHDYSKKGGVVYSEIILPENAPPEYEDRETLWNVVDAKEKRKDARLAKEIDLALPIEFDLKEQIEVLQQYIKENFTDKGVIVDLNIHNTGSGNPHAHIMFTTRYVTPDGFGKKNIDLDRRTNLLIWRESWAEVNNRKFEEKGLSERIDHRTLAAQGIDREPTIHLGHVAWALEKKGIRTERGDYNREVKRRNDERAALKEAEKAAPDKEKSQKHREGVKKEYRMEERRKITKEAKLEKELQNIREIRKTSPHSEKPLETENELPFVSKLEKQLKAEKATQYIEKMQAPPDAAKIAKHMNALKEKYIKLEKEKIPLIAQYNKDKHDFPPLEYLVESLEEHVENIEGLRGRVLQLREVRGNLRFLEFKQKKDTDIKIAFAEQELGRAQDFFVNHFHIDPAQVREELKRLQEDICVRKDDLKEKQVLVQAIREKQENIELEYYTQKLLNEIRPDKEQITQLLEQTRQSSELVLQL